MKKLSLIMLLSIVLVGCSNEPTQPSAESLFEAVFDNYMKGDLYINRDDATLLSTLFTPFGKTVAVQSGKISKQSTRNFTVPTSDGGSVRFEYQQMTDSSFAIYKVIDGNTTKYIPIAVGESIFGENFVMIQLDVTMSTPPSQITQKLRTALKDSPDNLIQDTTRGIRILSFKKSSTKSSLSTETPVLQNIIK